MLISDFQNSIQGRYLIKNIEKGLFVFDISNTVQSHCGLALSLQMTWGHSLAKRSPRPLSQETTSACLALSQSLTVPGSSLQLTRSSHSPPSPCSLVDSPFHFINIACVYIKHLWHETFFSSQSLISLNSLLSGCGPKGNSKARYSTWH